MSDRQALSQRGIMDGAGAKNFVMGLIMKQIRT